MSESTKEHALHNWTDSELASQLRFSVRFKGNPSGMYEQILCEAIARILERKPASKKRPSCPKE